jgi:hypothetical protein
MRPENAWQVFLDSSGSLYWVNSDETLVRQSARDGAQRIMDVIFNACPESRF